MPTQSLQAFPWITAVTPILTAITSSWRAGPRHEDLKLVAKALNAEGARYALIGGYAIAAHGYNRFSEDLDILVDPAIALAKQESPRFC